MHTEEIGNFFVTLKISKITDKRKNQSLDSFLNFMDTNLGALHEVSQINLQHALFDFYDK